jgi:hypothetical protein
MPSDDKTQVAVQYAIIAACMTGILLEIILLIFRGTIWGFWQFVLVVLIAAVAGVGGFFAGKMLG